MAVTANIQLRKSKLPSALHGSTSHMILEVTVLISTRGQYSYSEVITDKQSAMDMHAGFRNILSSQQSVPLPITTSYELGTPQHESIACVCGRNIVRYVR